MMPPLQFHMPSMGFLDYEFEGGQVKTDPETLKATDECPLQPFKSRSSSFFDYVNFERRFIHNYTQVTTPFTNLTTPKMHIFLSAETAFAQHPF